MNKPFILYTDASGIGVRAILAQKDDEGKEHVIEYASRLMNDAERNYPITEQEMLAVVWGIRKFDHYLGVQPFTLVTDHEALRNFQKTELPKGRRARWILSLQQYQFNVEHRKGERMQHVDNLSRYATPEECNEIPTEIQPMNETHQQFVQYAEIHQQYWQELLDGVDL